MEKLNQKKMLYVQTSDSKVPERVYAPFILATTAAAMGMKATIFFFLKGVTIVKKGEFKRTRLKGYPPFEEMVDQAVHAGVELEACEQSCMLLGLTKQDMVGAVKIVGAPTLNDRVLDADGVLSF